MTAVKKIAQKRLTLLQLADRIRNVSEVCGAIVGALAVMGLRFSRASEDEKEDPKIWSYADEVLERFQKEIAKNHGSILCKEIARVNWKDREQARSY